MFSVYDIIVLNFKSSALFLKGANKMKKRIISGLTIVSVLLLLALFAIWPRQLDTGDSVPPIPDTNYDALVLVDPSKETNTNQYDLKYIEKNNIRPESYHPIDDNKTATLYYQNNLSAVIKKTLTLNEETLCHYGLFEKNNSQFAIFHAESNTQETAERLCHLLLCYQDYFPTLLFGNFDETTRAYITEICNIPSSSINGITYFYQNLSSTPHQESGTLLLTFEETPRKLDLNQKMIALTFDDGPSELTSRILHTLTQHSAKATFFVNGSHVTEYPDTIRDIFDNHCEIGNHTNLHELFTHNTQAIIRKSIEETNKKIRNSIGIGTFVVRPPGGEILDRYQKNVKIGYPIVRWSLDTFDYTENQTASSLLNCIQSQIQNGDIILMHDTKAVTADALNSILLYLKEQQYQLVSVSELLEFQTNGANADVVYNPAHPSNT